MRHLKISRVILLLKHKLNVSEWMQQMYVFFLVSNVELHNLTYSNKNETNVWVIHKNKKWCNCFGLNNLLRKQTRNETHCFSKFAGVMGQSNDLEMFIGYRFGISTIRFRIFIQKFCIFCINFYVISNLLYKMNIKLRFVCFI